MDRVSELFLGRRRRISARCHIVQSALEGDARILWVLAGLELQTDKQIDSSLASAYASTIWRIPPDTEYAYIVSWDRWTHGAATASMGQRSSIVS